MKNDRLISEILESPDRETLRRQSLEAGLQALRGRRNRRSAVRAACGAAVLLALGAVFLPAIPKPRPPAVPALAGIRIITADELLAHFPDRGVALVGPAGRQELIFAAPQQGQP